MPFNCIISIFNQKSDRMKKVGLMAVLSLFVTAILIAFAPKEDMLSLGSEMPVQELKMKEQ